VARDAETGEIGVAVASRFFAVGHVVPWAKAGVGAVATQSFMNTSFGWRGLELLEMGLTPEEIVKVLTRNDDNPEQRQLGIVSADGKSATYTGKKCLAWARENNPQLCWWLKRKPGTVATPTGPSISASMTMPSLS
jgi:uncharacterized Ntn-hydrolase superfamily protein